MQNIRNSAFMDSTSKKQTVPPLMVESALFLLFLCYRTERSPTLLLNYILAQQLCVTDHLVLLCACRDTREPWQHNKTGIAEQWGWSKAHRLIRADLGVPTEVWIIFTFQLLWIRKHPLSHSCNSWSIALLTGEQFSFQLSWMRAVSSASIERC